MTGAGLVAWLAALPTGAMFSVFLTEVTAGLVKRFDGTRESQALGRTIVLMPAHDEAAGIERTIAEVLPRLPDGAQLLIVADNCCDNTAALARAAHCAVIERHDPAHRGKGYALAFGRDHLCANPPDCVIVLDADCVPEPKALALLAAEATRTGKPAQACYLMQPNRIASPMVQISNFAFLIKNLVRQRGASALGAPALLTGTGMAFPWAIFKDAPLASGNIVEDLALGVDLSRAGHAPRFLEQARVWSVAASEGDTLTQRTRWEHGFVATARSHGLPLALEGLRRGRWPLFWLGLHLLVPPLALLFMAGTVVLTMLLLLMLAGAGFGPALLLFSMMAASGLAILLAWRGFGRAMIAPGALLRLPLYALWKIPVYLKLVRGAETNWVRTKRPEE
ncbi:glycosyltransferase family 2 protein [Sphingobium boeckii]|uniref:Cellulose synthase/poly-beta-1,6-N-acetylglucosamine synthase-like glycosyltransferase n=1 Tax=Sphingobium boeckii TaxID=1082345 RepID=A0A7W9AJJ9_9SPHN|nr:glycosyltransferase family 2 protein [Sphingobium boeckii]MBB5686636.1 cellulose synthase/poly-beta-1,6-N-acetylglucosamine synthase-like glycosyltransferase [Sphingobium boeckii]